MDLRIGKFTITIRMTVVLTFLLATTITATTAISLQFYFGRNLAKQATTELYTLAASGVVSELENFSHRNHSLLSLLASNQTLADRQAVAAQLQLFADVLASNPLLYGIYIGRPDGSFLQLVNLDNSAEIRERQIAMPTDRWLVIRVENNPDARQRQFDYLDADFRLRTTRTETTDYDVRTRAWYNGALEENRVYESAPYLFAQLGVAGRTLARRVAGTETVVAVDFTLTTFSEWLRDQAAGVRGEIFVYRPDGALFASSAQPGSLDTSLEIPTLILSPEEQDFVAGLPTLVVSNEMDWPPYDYALIGEPRGYSVDVVKLIAAMTGLRISWLNGLSWSELVDRFQAGDIDLLHSVLLNPDNAGWGLPTDAYAQLPYTVATLSRQEPVRDLAQLADRTLAIPAGWSIASVVRDRFPTLQVVDARSTLHALQLVLDGEVDAALDNDPIMQYIQRHYFLSGLQYHTQVGLGEGPVPDRLHILVARDQTMLANIINKAIAAIGESQRAYLDRRWLQFDGPQFSNEVGAVPHESLLTIPESPELAGTLVPVRHLGEPHFAFAVAAGNLRFGVLTPQTNITGPFMERVRLSITITALLLFLLLPLSWYFANPIVRPIRQLAGENDKVRRRDYDAVQRVPSSIREIDQLSRSMVAMVQSIRAHEMAQRELMDAFIRLIAQAIDDKSPYTGRHCERVPELAMMLAEKATRSNLPVFQSFRLETPDQWREFRIAAWLHDCGKITTPEHIVDKGSKLETIYNRIHEVRMRFEVLWREAEIDYLRRAGASPEREPELRAERDATWRRLQEDFAFVAACNVGGEHLAPEDLERLNRIAATTWTRYFSNRIGLSPVEELRLPESSEALPVQEPLLADRPEHRIPHTHATDYPPEYGIDMEIPALRANLGELYNLAVSRGTLTAEDRFRIKAHMIGTIKMLESLPFPEELKRVPRYASTHHETLRGDGYPRRLPAAELSVPERLLALADVFEALTASDRPYKKAKPVSEAVAILHRMVEKEHLDRDSFELFLREGVYLDYAHRFLAPEQIDPVDVERYLGPQAT